MGNKKTVALEASGIKLGVLTPVVCSISDEACQKVMAGRMAAREGCFPVYTVIFPAHASVCMIISLQRVLDAGFSVSIRNTQHLDIRFRGPFLLLWGIVTAMLKLLGVQLARSESGRALFGARVGDARTPCTVCVVSPGNLGSPPCWCRKSTLTSYMSFQGAGSRIRVFTDR